mgnify:FL=1
MFQACANIYDAFYPNVVFVKTEVCKCLYGKRVCQCLAEREKSLCNALLCCIAILHQNIVHLHAQCWWTKVEYVSIPGQRETSYFRYIYEKFYINIPCCAAMLERDIEHLEVQHIYDESQVVLVPMKE